MGMTALAGIIGADPAAGAWGYHLHDHLGSTRRIHNQAKDRTARFDFTPYGEIFHAENPATAAPRFTGKTLDAESGLYYHDPKGYYDPVTVRWLGRGQEKRDPLGMTNGTYSNAPANGPISATEKNIPPETKNDRKKKCKDMIGVAIDKYRALLKDVINCQIPGDLGYGVGPWWADVQGMSPRPGRIAIKLKVCEEYDAFEFDRLVLHEIAHAIYRFSRVRYILDKKYRAAEECRANTWRDKCFEAAHPELHISY